MIISWYLIIIGNMSKTVLLIVSNKPMTGQSYRIVAVLENNSAAFKKQAKHVSKSIFRNIKLFFGTLPKSDYQFCP